MCALLVGSSLWHIALAYTALRSHGKSHSPKGALRIQLWWGVLIHDYWSSFAHGTPPTVCKDNYDVPLPAPAPNEKGPAVFHHLCRLTQILGDVLPLVYCFEKDYDDMWKRIRRLECSIDEWEDHLASHLRPFSIEGREIEYSNGLSSLRFCFLQVKLLVCRLASQVRESSIRSSESPITAVDHDEFFF